MRKRQKTVWITGASSGIGLAFAQAYAKAFPVGLRRQICQKTRNVIAYVIC